MKHTFLILIVILITFSSCQKQTAKIKITTTPEDAGLLIDDAYNDARTPAKLVIEPGAHSFILSRDDYDDAEFSYFFHNGEKHEVDLQLNKCWELQTGCDATIAFNPFNDRRVKLPATSAAMIDLEVEIECPAQKFEMKIQIGTRYQTFKMTINIILLNRSIIFLFLKTLVDQ